MDYHLLVTLILLGVQFCVLWLAVAMEEPRWALIPASGILGRLLGLVLCCGAAALLLALAHWLR